MFSVLFLRRSLYLQRRASCGAGKLRWYHGLLYPVLGNRDGIFYALNFPPDENNSTKGCRK